MPDRIPLRPGKTTPAHVEKALAVFGNNPYGEPNYRLIWSERKEIYFPYDLEGNYKPGTYPEYGYLPHPAWVLEVWTAPEKDAGSMANWSEMQEMAMGPYPQWGTYNYSQHFPKDWTPTENNARLAAVGIEISKQLGIKAREDAIRQGLKDREQAGIKRRAEEIVELFGSAELGKVTQPVSGRNNVFRTAEDFGRDKNRMKDIPGLPKSGGAIIN